MKKDKRMQLWLSTTHADEEGPAAIEGKYATVLANKEQVAELAIFLAQAAE